MLIKMEDLPAEVLGVRASGEVNKEDMDSVLLPGLDDLVKRTGEIRYLLVLETGVQNFTLAAWWKDMVAGLRHFTSWHRIAVVSDQTAVEWFTDVFQLVVPGKSKGFSPDELEQAKKWIIEA
ncbi:MAG: STAS/SEC14 domain-containing protein [Mucilaginibacter sp.]|nr:STAS/SEC14 domain-containing protein [Mucilaginibacter sp.]